MHGWTRWKHIAWQLDSDGCNTTKRKLGCSKGELNGSKRRIGLAGDDTMAQSEQVWVGTSVFTGPMYQHQDVSVENKGGRVD
jgi:hypothetical protein